MIEINVSIVVDWQNEINTQSEWWYKNTL